MESQKRKFLAGHKKVGKRLIPPLMQIEKVVPISFRDTVLPDLIWISSIFLQNNDQDAVNMIIEYLCKCEDSMDDDKCPPLAFLSNFNKLTDKQKTVARMAGKELGLLTKMKAQLVHQQVLLTNYPLAFLFENAQTEVNREEAVEKLKADISPLLDRYSHHATKVQTTAIVSMMSTGKLFINQSIDLPDFNAIFYDPESDESKRVASFVRAGLNAGSSFGFDSEIGDKNTWACDFWNQAYFLGGCQ